MARLLEVTDTTLGGSIGMLDLSQLVGVQNVTSFGAKLDGVTDDSAALTAACAAGPGIVYVPPGTLGIAGTVPVPSNVRIVGAGKNASAIKKLTAFGSAPALSFSGASNVLRCQRGGVMDVRLDGAGFTGPMVAAKWADHMNFDRVWWYNNGDVMLDYENVFDTYHNQCEFDTAIGFDGFKPATLITGNTDDSSNIIVFQGCRWENFVDGALWVGARRPSSAYTLPTGTNPPYGIYLTNCKFETPQLRGLMFNESADIQAVHMDGMYVAARGLYTGISTGRTLFGVIGAGDHSFKRIRAIVNGSVNPTVDKFFAINTNAFIHIEDVDIVEQQAINTAVVSWDGGATTDFFSENLRTTNMAKLYGGALGNITQPTVASAATIAIPRGRRVVNISGTATVTAITALPEGTPPVTLNLTAAATLTDGGNLKLNANAVGPIQVTVWCDGTNWNEIARSAN